MDIIRTIYIGTYSSPHLFPCCHHDNMKYVFFRSVRAILTALYILHKVYMCWLKNVARQTTRKCNNAMAIWNKTMIIFRVCIYNATYILKHTQTHIFAHMVNPYKRISFKLTIVYIYFLNCNLFYGNFRNRCLYIW